MTRTTAWLCALLAVSWVAMFMLYVDNRFLASMAAARAEKEWVRPETISKLAEACETLAYVNRKDQALLRSAKNQMEEIDAIRQDNRERLVEPPRGRRRHDQVRRVAGRAHKGSDVGVGGGP